MDRVANFCSIINVGQEAKKRTVFLPNIKLYRLFAKAFLREGLIRGFRVTSDGANLCFFLAYLHNGTPLITKLIRESKSKKYQYLDFRDVAFLSKKNVFFLQTHKGILSNFEAFRFGLGGKLIINVNF